MLTLPLLPGTDGRKMSKSYGNSVNVADTPRDMYGKIMRISDDQIPPYLNVACMLMPADEVEALQRDYREQKRNPIELKVAIAHHVVSLYHGTETADAERDWFQTHIRERKAIDEQEIPEQEVTAAQLADDASWAGLMVALGLMKSKGEVRRLMKGGGFQVDGKKVTDIHAAWDGEAEVQVKFGKRRFVRLHQA